jgi:hypothetical protein
MQGKHSSRADICFPFYIDWAGIFAWCETLLSDSNKNISLRKIKSEKLEIYPEKLIFRIPEITFIFLMTKLPLPLFFAKFGSLWNK